MELNKIRYDKIKLLYKFNKILHFIEEHAEKDAKDAKDEAFHKFLDEVEEHVEEFIKKLDTMVSTK